MFDWNCPRLSFGACIGVVLDPKNGSLKPIINNDVVMGQLYRFAHTLRDDIPRSYAVPLWQETIKPTPNRAFRDVSMVGFHFMCARLSSGAVIFVQQAD